MRMFESNWQNFFVQKNITLILVTNDSDFSKATKDEVYSVIWLRIPQRSSDQLLASFKKLIAECKDYHSKLILLSIDVWKAFPLVRVVRQND